MKSGGTSRLAHSLRGVAETAHVPLLFRRSFLVTTLLVLIFLLTWAGALAPIDDQLMDWRFGLFKRPPTGSVLIVDIDSQSIAELKGWPWSRAIYAAVVKNLQAAGAQAIAIDVDFSSLSDEAGDRAFRDALNMRPGEVILPLFLQPQSHSNPSVM